MGRLVSRLIPAKGGLTLETLSLGLSIANLTRESMSLLKLQPIASPVDFYTGPMGEKYHTGLLNISLLHAAATPVGIFATFCLHVGTSLTVKGSGRGTAEVSDTPTKLTSTGAGGLIAIKAVAVEMRGAGIGGLCLRGGMRSGARFSGFW